MSRGLGDVYKRHNHDWGWEDATGIQGIYVRDAGNTFHWTAQTIPTLGNKDIYLVHTVKSVATE